MVVVIVLALVSILYFALVSIPFLLWGVSKRLDELKKGKGSTGAARTIVGAPRDQG